MKRLSLFVLLSLAASVAALLISSGCAGSSGASSSFEQVKPAPYQPGRIELRTQGGYDLLYSQQPESVVITSLRSATADYLQFYVTVLNAGSSPFIVSPGSMRLRFEGDDGKTVSVYAEENLPGKAVRDASEDARNALELSQATGQLYTSGEQSPGTGGSPAYGGASSSSEETQALLSTSTVEEGQRASGFVYAPAPTVDAGNFVLQVPAGGQTHQFRYTFQ